ncbi:hypothetical protein [Desulfonatronovibrio hydrogenovorans]|uniref:hypothetical protein n=1 Tax=Desulfonatronovibrio hydrogenovorans TaxID=53245 RepID=UPI00049199E7|nr:hypothetical protein [Desulfonatronovibrio hydrogenovorans]
MILEWKITKKAGHLRPKLHYLVRLEDFERDLAVPMVRITSTIPKPPEHWQGHVWPGTNELGSGYVPEYYDIFTPSHKTRELQEVLILPMQTDRQYPEVEESFLNLRRAYEEVLVAAYENSSYEQSGRLDMSLETKKIIAPRTAAARFLEALSVTKKSAA